MAAFCQVLGVNKGKEEKNWCAESCNNNRYPVSYVHHYRLCTSYSLIYVCACFANTRMQLGTLHYVALIYCGIYLCSLYTEFRCRLEMECSRCLALQLGHVRCCITVIQVHPTSQFFGSAYTTAVKREE